MKTGKTRLTRYGHLICKLTPAAILVLTVATGLEAAPPRTPLPAPEYSFDLGSPTVLDGTVGAADILTLGPDIPLPLIPAGMIDLFAPDDELDSLSGRNSDFGSADLFVLLISVDRLSEGQAEPDPLLVELERPYNVLDQAQRSQAAGDQFMGLELYTRGGRGAGKGFPTSSNTSLVRNNYDEGGTDFGAQPPTHASSGSRGTQQDNVDATARLLSRRGSGGVADVYFSLSAESPSLVGLPGAESPSGANLFYNAEPEDPLIFTELYAPHYELGLVQADDIDALIIFDDGQIGLYDDGDVVLFSLAPGSPSLTTIPGASQFAAAADIFVVGAGVPGGPRVFAPAAAFGLGSPSDNVDALDYFFCDDPLNCALEHSIRAVRGDWDDNGTVDLEDFVHWPECMTGPGRGVPPDCEPFDFDAEGDVDLADFTRFQQKFGSV